MEVVFVKRVEFEESTEMSDAGNDTVVDVTLQGSSASDRLKAVESMKLFELKEELKKRKFRTSGNKKELQDRLRAALILEVEHGADEDESEYDEDEDEREPASVKECTRRMQVLTFRDVEESLDTFSGDNKENIRCWLEEFEDMAELCEWSDVQKVIYAKRLLRGSAKMFVNYEKCCRKWSEMKRALRSEFSQVVDVHKIHKELSRRIKKSNETYQEYVYHMLEIAKQADMEVSAVIKYIIDGIQDEESNKMILYGARSIRELKEKFESYETMKENSRTRSRRTEEKAKKTIRGTTAQENIRRCFLCGDRNHLSADCPTKSRGTKCFKCKEYGHIAPECSGVKKPVKDVSSTSEESRKKRVKAVQIEHCKLVALIDSGSDLNLMRADHYIKIGAPKLNNKILQFRGVGTEKNYTMGEFQTNIVIDDTTYSINIHVVPDALTPHGLIIGTDFLDSVVLTMKGGEILIGKLDVPEVFNINVDNASEIDLSHIPIPEHREVIKDLIDCYEPHKTREVGVTMNIVLSDDIPVYQRPRRLSSDEKVEVDKQIAVWLEEGIVQSSHSDYASPIVLVKKKNGSTRICVDYRQLNKKVIKDRYPLPLIEDELDSLQDATIFSTLDLKNGFFHVPVEETSRKYTAFVVPNGHYEFLKVPFGLCNSPAVFQKFIHAVFREVIVAGFVRVYLDDVIILARDAISAIKNLKTVLGVASQFGLLINWSKCSFLQTRVEYLGHIIENGCVRPSEHKTKAVIKFPKLQCVKDVQSFLGLTGYFRKFICGYSIIARPLTNLLKKDNKFKFETLEQEAFEKLKLSLSSSPVLKLYRVGAETELHTDASSLGYGAILLQRDNLDGAFHPVYYASGKTTPAEENYPSYELEVLAIIKSLRKFRVYLLGVSFKIVTDCQAFVMTMNKKDLCVRVARWALLLEEFQYKVEHRSGKNMKHVDALSRHPLPTTMFVNEVNDGLIIKLRAAQNEDTDLQKIRDNIEKYRADGYVVKNDVLYRVLNDVPLVVVPKPMQVQVVRRAHERGHFGVTKTEILLRRDYWFKGMRQKVEKVIRSCVDCILAERKHGKQEGLLNTIDKGELPLNTYHVDHLGPLPSTRKSYRHIFAVVDAFSKFVWLYATKTTNSAEVITCLKKQALIFGNPVRIISDRGTSFTSDAFKDYCNSENILHVLITTGIPRANGQVERINRTLIPLLTKLSSPKPEEWYKYLGVAQKYLNATPHRSINTTPFHLLFGTHMRIREDPEIRRLIEEEWIAMFQMDRDEVRERAKEKIVEVQAQNRKTFNKNRKEAVKYKQGQLVAIKRTQAKPGLKFHAKYLGPYRIVKVLRNNRYVVQKAGEHEGPQTTSSAADHMKPWLINEENDFSEDCDSVCSDSENI